MADSGLVFPPGWRLTDSAGDVVPLGTIEVYAGGTSTPANVYSDSTLSTSLGATIYVNSAGYPVASQGSSTRVNVYAGDSLLKTIAKDADGNTLWSHDNEKFAEDHGSYLTSTDLVIPVTESGSTTVTITSSDFSKFLQYSTSGGNVSVALPAASGITNGKGVWLSRSGSSNDFTITPDGSDTIAGAATLALVADQDAVLLICNGTDGYRIGALVPGDQIGTKITQAALDSTFLIPAPPQGRLTLTSGTPVTTSDVTAATAVYYSVYNGAHVPIYDSTLAVFVNKAITGGELTLSLSSSHTADTLFDVFAFVDSGTLRIGTGPAWSDSGAGTSSRGSGAGTTELSKVSGLHVNTVSMTARNGANTYTVAANAGTYLGTFRTTGTNGQTEDSVTKRYLSNAYNTVMRSMYRVEGTNTWAGAGTTWRAVNNDASNNLLQVVQGLVRGHVRIHAQAFAAHSASTVRCAQGVGINVSNANSAISFGGIVGTAGGNVQTEYYGAAQIGFTQYYWIEKDDNTAGTLTWRGDEGSTFLQSGVFAEVYA